MSEHKVEIDLDKPYEEDVINFKGIIWFGAGLAFLIVLTFGLMWVLQYVVHQGQAEAADEKARQDNPMMLSDEERLPPEPRLQSAPGFGVDTKSGRKSLELREPQAEWIEIQKQYEDIWKNGEKNGSTVVALPIKEAQEKLLSSGSVKAASGEEAEKLYEESKKFLSSASSGRVASEKYR